MPVLHHRPDWFAGPHCRQQVRRGVLLGERQHAGQVTRRLVPHHPEDREYPRVVLIADQEHPSWPAGRGADEGQHLLQSARRDPQQLADVGRVHDDVVLNRSPIPEALQERWRVRTAAHGVHDEVGCQLLFGAAVAVDYSHAGDAIAIRRRRQLGHVLAAEDGHVLNRLQAPPDMALQERPARHIHRDSFGIDG